MDTSDKSNDFDKRLFGDVLLWLHASNSSTDLKITVSLLDNYSGLFNLYSNQNVSNLYFLEAYIKLSEYVYQKYENCKQLTFTKMSAFAMTTIILNCSWYNAKSIPNYMMEVTVLKNMLYVPKKLLFSIPDPLLFGKKLEVIFLAFN